MIDIIYMFLDKDKNILYIGKTSSFKSRMSQHFNKKEMKDNQWKQEIKYIRLFFFDNPVDMSIYEIYWINKYNPKYNKSDNFVGYNSLLVLNESIPNKTINIDDLHFKTLFDIEYNYKELCHINKNIIRYDYKYNKLFEESHTYSFLNKHSKLIKNEIYNILKNKLKVKSKNVSIHFTYPNLYDILIPNSYKKSFNNYSENVEIFIYVGYINLDGISKKETLNYNIYNFYKTINNIQSNEFLVFVTSKELRDVIKFNQKESDKCQ